MSASQETNYGPPPTLPTSAHSQLQAPPMSQYTSMMNGYPQQPQQQQQQQQFQPQQSFQPQDQKQMNSSAGAPPPSHPSFLNSNISKFMPPQASTPTASPNPMPAYSNLNGPSSAKSPIMPSSGGIPAHLRPPGMGFNPSATSSPHLNGNGLAAGNLSSNSSRTASPALQGPPPPSQIQGFHQQQQQQLPPRTSTFNPNNNNVNNNSSNLTGLTNSMQNLNMNYTNGPGSANPAAPSMQKGNFKTSTPDLLSSAPPPVTSATTNNNFGGGNGLPMPPPTSSMNFGVLPPSTTTTTNSRPIPGSGFPTPPASSSSAMNFNQQASLASSNSISRPMPPSASNGAPAKPPTSAGMPMPPFSTNQPMPPSTAGQAMPPTSSGMFMPPSSVPGPNVGAPQALRLPPPPTTSSSFNSQPSSNAPMQQTPQPPQQQFNQQIGGLTQQKRIYPSTGPLPPMPGQPQNQAQQPQQMQQQQAYPYAQAYQQQQQNQPMQQQPLRPAQYPQQQPQQPQGLFNGTKSSGPLQYQNQYPSPQQQQQQQQQGGIGGAPQSVPQYPSQQSNIVQQGFSRLWGQDTIDLMQNRHIMAPTTLAPPKVLLHNQFHEAINCSPSIMRCTMAKIPESNSLLQKSRLPLGILIHPFRDINSLPVIQCPSIVRCRLCRTYINPFVYFVDSKMWKCNLCYRVNELPEDFQFDPATKTYGDVTRRPEVRSSTIEFIAPSEYMLRPPQPAIYLFLFDVSIIAQQCGYLESVCSTLSKHLDDMPGDARTQVGFIAYNSCVHFYGMSESYNQPHEMTLIDIDDIFLPRPDNLLVNLKECKELIKDLLNQMPHRFADTHDPGSALGAALQIAYKLMQNSGGRITVFQTCLPNKGPGSLEPREDPNNRSAKDVAHLNPATDFYKRYALECSGYQIAVDLFLLNQQYSDLATISGISKHSGGCMYHFPLYQKTKQHNVDSLKQSFKRYLTRKIGFEAVMRIRCTRGLQVHTFHGNFFVRSTDLLSLPNVNPDAGYGMQISYEESLSDAKTVCFQAALLYTSSEGERRIRVHTMCLPTTNSLAEIMHSADTEAIIGLLSKMAVDRSLTSNISDAREAFINATIDIMNAFKVAQNLPSGQTGQLVAPRSLALLPLYILALLKHPAFRVGTSTRLDDRVHAMDLMKTLPLDQLIRYIYPEFYNIDALFYYAQTVENNEDDDDDNLPEITRLQLSAEHLDSRSVFIMDCGNLIMIYVGLNVPTNVLQGAFGIKSTSELPDYYYGLPQVDSPENDILRRFIMKLNDDKPFSPLIQIIRDTSTAKPLFIEKLFDDRSESSLSYYEFLQHIRAQVK